MSKYDRRRDPELQQGYYAADLRKRDKGKGLRLTGGEHKGRSIRTPRAFVRPMMAAVRESLFSMLSYTNIYREDTLVLDLFSGSGVIGLEGLSRGAGHVTFVDSSPVCTQTIKANCEDLGLTDRTLVIRGDVFDVLDNPVAYLLEAPGRLGTEGGPVDLVTAQPPYDEVDYGELVEALAESTVVGPNTYILLEYPLDYGCFPPTLCRGRFVGLRNRKFGRTYAALYVCEPTDLAGGMTPRAKEFAVPAP